VHHGRLFTKRPPPANVPTPRTPRTPDITTPALLEGATNQLSPRGLTQPKFHPYITLGFAFDQAICWISDVSFIPEETWDILKRHSLLNSKLPVLVVDCLGITSHTSHFGLKDSVTAISRIGAQKSYLIGFGHRVPHEAWTRICESIERNGNHEGYVDDISETVNKGLGIVNPEHLRQSLYIRPSYDGLRLNVSGDGGVDEVHLET